MGVRKRVVEGGWNRDAAYHPWLVDIAAEHAGDVLDVGCGDGALAVRLAAVSRSVVAIDIDPEAVDTAQERLRFVPGAEVQSADFTTEWGLTPESFDVITMLDVVHELTLDAALDRARTLLKPGGALLVVGVTVAGSPWEKAVTTLLRPVGDAIGLWHAFVHGLSPEFDSAEPVVPAQSLGEVRAIAGSVLPGAQVRRGLHGRYTLRWRKPVPVREHALLEAGGGAFVGVAAGARAN